MIGMIKEPACTAEYAAQATGFAQSYIYQLVEKGKLTKLQLTDRVFLIPWAEVKDLKRTRKKTENAE